MVLSVTQITAVSPRGARPGVDITIDGGEFGATQGTVAFDPLGENLQGAIISWGPSQVVVTVPALVQGDRFVDLLLTIDGGGDLATAKFWIPNTGLSGPYALPAGMGYQLPNAEAGGPNESVDSPTLQQAADINRLLDRLLVTGSSRQETFTGEVAAQGVPTVLGLELAERPVSAESVQLHLWRDPGGGGDTQGGLLRLQGTDYSVDISTRKVTWLASAPIALAAADLLTYIYPSRGLA